MQDRGVDELFDLRVGDGTGFAELVDCAPFFGERDQGAHCAVGFGEGGFEMGGFGELECAL